MTSKLADQSSRQRFIEQNAHRRSEPRVPAPTCGTSRLGSRRGCVALASCSLMALLVPRGAAGSQTTPAAQPRIEQVPHRITQHVEAVHTIVRHSPGHSASHGACSMNRRPSRLSIPPQLGTLTGSPNPRKLKLASARMTPPTLMLKTMISGATMLGRTWRTRTCRVGEPTARAARKKSFSLVATTAPLTTREPPTPPARSPAPR